MEGWEGTRRMWWSVFGLKASQLDLTLQRDKHLSLWSKILRNPDWCTDVCDIIFSPPTSKQREAFKEKHKHRNLLWSDWNDRNWSNVGRSSVFMSDSTVHSKTVFSGCLWARLQSVDAVFVLCICVCVKEREGFVCFYCVFWPLIRSEQTWRQSAEKRSNSSSCDSSSLLSQHALGFPEVSPLLMFFLFFFLFSFDPPWKTRATVALLRPLWRPLRFALNISYAKVTLASMNNDGFVILFDKKVQKCQFILVFI